MIPILYDSTEKAFTSNGIGRLYDAISCTVNEKRNGSFTLSLQYPRNGRYANKLKTGCIIFATHDSKRKPQAFDIVSVQRDTAGVIDIEAQHISYRMKNILTRMHMMSLAVSPAVYFDILTEDIQKDVTDESKFLSCKSDFRFYSDVDEAYVREFLEVSDEDTFAPPGLDLGDNVYDLLLSSQGIMSRQLVTDNNSTSIKGYGDCGDYKFDMFDVHYLKDRGADYGIKLRTGVNVKRLTIVDKDDDTIQAVMPVWIGRDKFDGLRLSANLWDSNKQSDALVYDDSFEGDYSYIRCEKLDLSSKFETKPTVAQLRSEAQRYLKEKRIMNKNKKRTYSADIVESDKNTALLQKCDLCDTVTVEDAESGTRDKLKIVEVTYDVLRDLYTHMIIAKPEPTLLELIDNRTQSIEDKAEKALTQVADTAQKANVEQKVYPTSYDPQHPENWDDSQSGPLYDASGKEVEQVATINRKPVFVYKQGGSGSISECVKFFYFNIQSQKLENTLVYKHHVDANGNYTVEELDSSVINLVGIDSGDFFDMNADRTNEAFIVQAYARFSIGKAPLNFTVRNSILLNVVLKSGEWTQHDTSIYGFIGEATATVFGFSGMSEVKSDNGGKTWYTMSFSSGDRTGFPTDTMFNLTIYGTKYRK